MYHVAPGAFEDALGIVEKTDTAVNSITAGQFVVWKGHLRIATDDISVGDTLSSSNLDEVVGGGFNNVGGGSGSNEVGEIRIWTSATAPDKWLICDGTTISRTTYADLFAVLGSTYGGGDGSTTFAIPDFKGRSPLGAGESTATGHSAHTLGLTGGEEKHSLQAAENGSHSHGLSNAQLYCYNNSGGAYKTATSGGNWTVTDRSGISKSTNSQGSGTGHNTLHPYTNVNFIIYTGVSAA